VTSPRPILLGLPGELAEREADPRGRAQAEGGQARPLAQANPLNRDPQDHHQIMEDTTEDILLRLILEAILLEIEDQHQDLQDQATHLRASQAPDLAPMDPRPLLPRDPLSVMDPRTPGQENILQ